MIVAKFKEKVKLSESTLGQLVASDDKVSNSDEVIEETEETQIDGYTLIKEESEVDEQEVTESYEEVEFLELNGHNDTLNAIQFVTIGKSDDDQFIDEIIEECSVEGSETVDTIFNESVDTTIRNSSVKVC